MNNSCLLFLVLALTGCALPNPVRVPINSQPYKPNIPLVSLEELFAVSREGRLHKSQFETSAEYNLRLQRLQAQDKLYLQVPAEVICCLYLNARVQSADDPLQFGELFHQFRSQVGLRQARSLVNDPGPNNYLILFENLAEPTA